ncbi:MAG: sulfite exporter TauE/SafE family protein [Promethearchaeota archaeon]
MDLTLFLPVILLAVGIGFLASLFGIGGGFLLVPTMIMFLGLTTHETVGTIPLVIMFMSLSSTFAYAKQKRVDYLITMIIASSTVIGSVIGAMATMLVSSSFILVMFGLVEAFLAAVLAVKKTPQEVIQSRLENNLNGETEIINDVFFQAKEGKKWYIINRAHVDVDGNKYYYSANLLISFPLSFIAGFLSSMLGIGGGTLYIQIFVFVCGMSIHMAIACSIATIFISATSSFFTFAALGEVDYIVALAYGIGMIIGAQIGAKINKKIKSKYLKPLAAAMIIFIAVRMIFFALLENPA